MALQKAVEQSSGYTANYWRIDKVEIDWRHRRASIRLTGYKDEQTRRDDPRGSVMDQRSYSITGVRFNQFFDVPDKDQIQQYDSTQDYNKGELVVFKKKIYEATENVPSGSKKPDETSLWEVNADLRVDRVIAYDHIKNNDVDFVDANDV